MAKILHILSLLLVIVASIFAPLQNTPMEKERATVVGHIANPDRDINWAENKLYLTTYYFGDFVVSLPEDVSIESVLSYEHVKVTFAAPTSRFPEDSRCEVNAVAIEGRPTIKGKLLAQTDTYIDIEIWTFSRDSEREGQIQRIALNDDSVFSRPISIGEDVNITYETDGETLTALLITGFVG